jgi:methylated-DNA-[protein]-cysteine S-methyltransferase
MDSHGQNEQRVVWTVVGADIGPLLLAATQDGLVNVVFHATDAVRERTLDRLASRLGTEPVEAPDSPLLAEAIRQVEAYFAGARRDFDLPLDWSLISGFNRQVLRELASGVPYGSVVGYGDLAGRVGQPRAAQAVASAGSGADWRRRGSCWRWRGCCPSRCSEGADGEEATGGTVMPGPEASGPLAGPRRR